VIVRVSEWSSQDRLEQFGVSAVPPERVEKDPD